MQACRRVSVEEFMAYTKETQMAHHIMLNLLAGFKLGSQIQEFKFFIEEEADYYILIII